MAPRGSIDDVVERLKVWCELTPRGLAFVEFHSEPARQEVLRRLRASLPEDVGSFHEISLAPAPTAVETVHRLVEELESLGASVVSVDGFGPLFPPAHPPADLVSAFNFNRERLAAPPLRQIWWIPGRVVDAFLHGAPDLYSWFRGRWHLTASVETVPERHDWRRMNNLEVEKDWGDKGKVDVMKGWEKMGQTSSSNPRDELVDFEQVRSTSPAAADVLRASAFLATADIPLEFLTEGGFELGSELAEALGGGDPVDPDDLLVLLQNHSLIHRDAEAKTWSITPRLREMVLGDVDADARHEWTARIVRALNATFPDNQYADWPLCERLTPHVQFVFQENGSMGLESEEAGQLLDRTALYLSERGRFAEAEPLLLRSLRLHEKLLGSQHSLVARSLNNLAHLYHLQGRYAEADSLYQRSLGIVEKVSGGEHLNVASALNNLASLYRDQGRYTEAEPLFERSLRITEGAVRKNHPTVASLLNNLASLYRVQGRDAEAELTYNRSLAITEEVLGADHPYTGLVLHNLGRLRHAQGRYQEAETLYQRALGIWESTLGNHPYVDDGLESYAALLRDLHRNAEAEELEVRLREARERRS